MSSVLVLVANPLDTALDSKLAQAIQHETGGYINWLHQRVACERLGHDCWRVTVRYGFMNRPDIGASLALCGPAGLTLDPIEVSYFLSREKIEASDESKSSVARWRDRVFAVMARNAGSATDYFNIPPNRVVELGTRVEI